MQDLFIAYSLDTFLPGYDLSGVVPSTIYLILVNGQVAAAPTGCPCGGQVTKKNSKNYLPAVPRRGPEAGVHHRETIFRICVRTVCEPDSNFCFSRASRLLFKQKREQDLNPALSEPSFHFKPIDESTRRTIRICHRNSIGSRLFGCSKCEPGLDLRRAFPCDTPCINNNCRTRGFSQFSSKTLLETLTKNCHWNIISKGRYRTDTGDTT